MSTTSKIHDCPLDVLAAARNHAHKAAQLLTKAARANLEAQPDDSHSNLSWDAGRGAFLSQPLAGDVRVGLDISALRLIVAGSSDASLDLNGKSDAEALDWLDAQLAQSDLKPASATMLPYDLPGSVEAVDVYDGTMSHGHSALAAWYDLANALFGEFAKANSDIQPGPSPVRCWPHHFDIATYVALESGDFETARGVGVGLSPGDATYDQPYFYVNPWPHLNADELPELPAPGYWHTQGFVGAIATAKHIFTLSDIDAELPAFIAGAFAVGRQKLGA
jgi:hypothetical protein